MWSGPDYDYSLFDMWFVLPPVLPVALGFLAALGCLVAALHYFRRKRAVDDTPTSKARGVFIGLTELKGTAESETALTSYLAGVRCVQYSWRVQEHWSRTVHETYRDAQGRMQTRTRTESGWATVDSGEGAVPFYLRDDTGVIRIRPEGAAIEGVTTFDQTCTRDNPLYYGKGPQRGVANSDHRRQFRETAVSLHAALYVVGPARERQDVVAAEIAYDKDTSPFLISSRTEKQVSTGYGRWSWFWLVMGLVVAVGGVVAQGVVQTGDATTVLRPYAVAAGAYLAAVGLGWLWTAYNSFINLHHRVEQAWSQVDVQLKRRNDLIPGLVRAVEGYRAHESQTQQLLAGLRGQAAATPPGVAGPDFRGLAPELRVLIERYPELKAGESFLRLQQELVDTEQRIALARDYFNEVATFYNTRLQIVPDRFAGALARLRPRALMAAADFERAPVTVNLAS